MLQRAPHFLLLFFFFHLFVYSWGMRGGGREGNGREITFTKLSLSLISLRAFGKKLLQSQLSCISWVTLISIDFFQSSPGGSVIFLQEVHWCFLGSLGFPSVKTVLALLEHAIYIKGQLILYYIFNQVSQYRTKTYCVRKQQGPAIPLGKASQEPRVTRAQVVPSLTQSQCIWTWWGELHAGSSPSVVPGKAKW